MSLESGDNIEESTGPEKRSSRFNVVKVEFLDEKCNSLMPPEHNIYSKVPLGGGHKRKTSRRESILSIQSNFQRRISRRESIGSQPSLNGWKGKSSRKASIWSILSSQSFGGNTLETLPHLDHYRNLLSISASEGIRQRPTLLELHEEKVCPSYFKVHSKPLGMRAGINI